MLALCRTREFKILAPIAIVTGLTVLFIRIADEMLEGETHGFDQVILLAFRTSNTSDPIGPAWLELVMQDLTSLGGHTVLTLISLVSIGYLMIRRQHGAAMMVAVSALGGMALNYILKLGFDRPRPELVAHLAEVQTLSFPSGHAMLSAIVYLTLGALLARSQHHPLYKAYILVVAVISIFLVGISRIYLGVHWPTDVIAGWCIGAAWAILALQSLRYLSGCAKI